MRFVQKKHPQIVLTKQFIERLCASFPQGALHVICDTIGGLATKWILVSPTQVTMGLLCLGKESNLNRGSGRSAADRRIQG